MPRCPCPISKSNQKIFTLIDKREAVTSTVDGTCTSMIWTAFVRNRETNINSAVVGVIIVFSFDCFAEKRLRPHYWDFTLTKIFKTKKSWIQIFSDFSGVDSDQKWVCSAPLLRLSMQSKMAFLGNHCQAMALARLIQSGAFIDSKSCFA